MDAVRACAEALSRAGARAAAEREAVLQQLAALLDPEAQQQGLEAAAAVAEALATEHLLNAAALAVLPDAQPSEAAIEVCDMQTPEQPIVFTWAVYLLCSLAESCS